MSDDRNIDFVLRTVEKRDIRFVRLWFTDVLGTLKSFAISAEDLEEAFEEGVGFDGSAVEGFVPMEESDMLAFPDPSTFQILPTKYANGPSARVICDIRTPHREPFEGDPALVLARCFARWKSVGMWQMLDRASSTSTSNMTAARFQCTPSRSTTRATLT